MSGGDWQKHAAYIIAHVDHIQAAADEHDLELDYLAYSGVLRFLQTLSESTRFLPDDEKASYPDIPSQEITAFRNRLTHGYMQEIDPQVVLQIIEDDLPELKRAVQDMLDRNPA